MEDIGAIKVMLRAIFTRYKDEMTELKELVASAEKRLEAVEVDVNGRMNRIEDAVSRTQRAIYDGTKTSKIICLKVRSSRFLHGVTGCLVTVIFRLQVYLTK